MADEQGIGSSCGEIKWTLTQAQMHRFFVALAEQARFVLPQNNKSYAMWREMVERCDAQLNKQVLRCAQHDRLRVSKLGKFHGMNRVETARRMAAACPLTDAFRARKIRPLLYTGRDPFGISFQAQDRMKLFINRESSRL
ncbi:MAG TPA: hypothetical protein VJN48_03765 [Terriglobales bacterium]|nr:hypothetical protein [Terriglobales bacterium]